MSGVPFVSEVDSRSRGRDLSLLPTVSPDTSPLVQHIKEARSVFIKGIENRHAEGWCLCTQNVVITGEKHGEGRALLAAVVPKSLLTVTPC